MSNNSGNGSRWWEFNLVRYFLGTLIGSFIVYLLFNHFVDSLMTEGGEYEEIRRYLCEIQSYHVGFKLSIFLAFGLVFCYISSAPILVLHATRFNQKNKVIEGLIFGVSVAFLLCTVLPYIDLKQSDKELFCFVVIVTIALPQLKFLIIVVR